MDLSSPLSDIVPGARGRVLAALAQLEVPVTARALARHAAVAPQTAVTVVNELVDVGLVHAQHLGPAWLVTLNRTHLLASPLVALGRTRGRLIEMLTGELAQWTDLAGAWLFGSAARATGGRHSDVDLLLVAEANIETEPWEAAAARLVDQVHLWTGNQAQLVEHSRSSFARLIRDGNALVAAVRDEGIPLTPGTRSLLRRAG